MEGIKFKRFAFSLILLVNAYEVRSKDAKGIFLKNFLGAPAKMSGQILQKLSAAKQPPHHRAWQMNLDRREAEELPKRYLSKDQAENDPLSLYDLVKYNVNDYFYPVMEVGKPFHRISRGGASISNLEEKSEDRQPSLTKRHSRDLQCLKERFGKRSTKWICGPYADGEFESIMLSEICQQDKDGIKKMEHTNFKSIIERCCKEGLTCLAGSKHYEDLLLAKFYAMVIMQSNF